MIIGITGRKGSGKDTIASYLVDNYDFIKLGFADQLKEAVANLFGLTIKQVDEFKEIGIDDIALVEVNLQIRNQTEWCFSWREFLQRFGTEMGRETFGLNFWVDLWEDRLYRESLALDKVVVPDTRFQNEAVKIQELSGVIIEVSRPGHESDGHASEEPLPDLLIDYRISNDGTIEDLQNKIRDFVLAFVESS